MTPQWWLTKDGDEACLQLFRRHYSAPDDGRARRLFVGPGEKLVLRTEAGDAFFVWRKFYDACLDPRTTEGQAGVACAAFRNEGTVRSAELISQADRIADVVWPDCRHYTYVDPRRVASGLPGRCFLAAGWRYARYAGHRICTPKGLFILERRPCGI